MRGGADQLGITPLAVSRQLSAYRSFVKIPLTERQVRRLVLAAYGRCYCESASAAFSVFHTSATQLRRSRLLGASPGIVRRGSVCGRSRSQYRNGDCG
ncbi:LysR family transcriptional regulator [Bradyrhizobium sp. WD16]|uniref:LysR family transcriptional regulator n=1 Tax=Bradyrhizobium sp. WD16 TaxID=1521768 RepID=UPI002208CAC1|nr:hypothetical protein DB459_25470 [Bradyrhizobium sp. WD16]